MSAHSTPDSIRGVFVAAITPRREGEATIDTSALFKFQDFVESHGVDGLTLFGSTGEFMHYSIEDRVKTADMVIKRSKVPVVINTAHSTLDGSVRLAEEAASSGAKAVLVMPPYYFHYSQEAIKSFCLDFAEDSPLPTFLYNIPFFTDEIELKTTLDLLETGAFVGIKDSGGNWDHFVALQALAERKGLSVLLGSDGLYSKCARVGAAGCVSGIASALPELMVAIDRAARAGQDTSALDGMLQEFIHRAMDFPIPIGMREGSALRGIPVGPHASPLGDANTKKLEAFREWFPDWLAAHPVPKP